MVLCTKQINVQPLRGVCGGKLCAWDPSHPHGSWTPLPLFPPFSPPQGCTSWLDDILDTEVVVMVSWEANPFSTPTLSSECQVPSACAFRTVTAAILTVDNGFPGTKDLPPNPLYKNRLGLRTPEDEIKNLINPAFCSRFADSCGERVSKTSYSFIGQRF